MSTTTSEHTTPLSEIIVTRCHEGNCTASHTASWGQHDYCTTCKKETCEWCTEKIIDQAREESLAYAMASDEWDRQLAIEYRDMLKEENELGEEFNRIIRNARKLRLKKKKSKN